jgi:DNA-binding IclR family transcriptional regulator
LDLLGCFTPREPELGLVQLAERSGLSLSTVFRLLQTLEGRGYVEQDADTGRYRLGLSCLCLSETVIAQLDLRERLRPLLDELREGWRETVHLAVLDRKQMEVVYLDKLDGLLPIGMMSSRVGGRAPAYCTGVGKVLLAFAEPVQVLAFYGQHPFVRYTPRTIADVDALAASLEEVRRRGYALDDVEHEADVKCIAVPVRSHTGLVVASISVSGPRTRMDGYLAQGGLAMRMLEAGEEGSRRLGYRG